MNEIDAEKLADILFKKISDNTINPIMVQLPLPTEMRKLENNILNNIPHTLDVDGLTDNSRKTLFSAKCVEGEYDKYFHKPCTARGIVDYISHLDGDLSGKSILIINRSDLVGLPLFKLCLDKNMRVCVAHSHIPKSEIMELIPQYDYIVLGVGQKDFVVASELKMQPDKQITIIDVSINFKDDGKLCGDFTPDDESKDIRYTPVPNGVGQLTVLSLMKNILNM